MNKKILSGIIAAVMLAGTMPLSFAADFGIGEKYTAEEDTAAKQQTESLYNNRKPILKQAEDLGRGLVAVPSKEGILVSWRFLGTDDVNLAYDLYRNGEKLATVSKTTNYLDKDGKAGDEYKIVAGETEMVAKAWDKEYMSIPVKQYDKGNYIVDDATVGDLDGDGEYEIIVRRTPADYFNQMSVEEGTGKVIDTRVAYPLVEAYKMDGTYMWTLDIGKNEANEIDVNVLVYDFDGDGKAEVVMRSYDGMTDGVGNKIGIADADYTQSLQKQKDRQYLSEGNEYLSVFDGETGEEVARTELLPKRDPLESWSSRYTDVSRLTKRASHYLFAPAYLNGETPSIVMLRGAWDGVKLAAWDYKDKKFNVLWQYDSGDTTAIDNAYGAGYHSLSVNDIDFDGKDEILSGAMAIDDNGKFMYATYTDGSEKKKLGHGDAFDVAKMDPDYNGYYVWSCHEEKNLPANIDLHDARTGQVIYGFNKPKDTGRSRAADIDPTSEGWEVWGSTGTSLMSYDGNLLVSGIADTLKPMLDGGKLKLASGETLADGWNTFRYRYADGTYQTDLETGNVISATLPMNFKAYWDGDLLSELVDGTTISKYNWEDKCVDILYEAKGAASNNGTKAVPCLAADIFGDWREEIIWRDENNTELRIYATPYETEYKIPTLMHDITYREAVAWQNNHYNQPANTSFYMGAETVSVPMPEIKTISGKSGKIGESIKIKQNDDNNTVVLKIGSPNALVGESVKMIDSDNADVVPAIVNDRTLVPLRFISENFGAKVDWNGDTKEITITLGDKIIKMTIDADTYFVNDEEKELDCPPQIYNDRTMVPVRAVLESLSKQLYWNGDYQLVVISDDVSDADSLTGDDWAFIADAL